MIHVENALVSVNIGTSLQGSTSAFLAFCKMHSLCYRLVASDMFHVSPALRTLQVTV